MWHIHIMYLIYIRSSRKDKNASSKSAKSDEIKMTDAASIQGSPTDITYATTIPSGGGKNESELQYAYARTGPINVSHKI